MKYSSETLIDMGIKTVLGLVRQLIDSINELSSDGLIKTLTLNSIQLYWVILVPLDVGERLSRIKKKGKTREQKLKQ